MWFYVLACYIISILGIPLHTISKNEVFLEALMKKAAFLLAFLTLGCGVDLNFVPVDAGPRPDSTDITYDGYTPDVVISDSMPPSPDGKWEPHKCSPQGYYSLSFYIYDNTCPGIIVPQHRWKRHSYYKSYWCGKYLSDSYALHKEHGVPVHCWHYTETFPEGLKVWSNCTVHNWEMEELCKFSYTSSFTYPDGW
jgi:hypothetical protein